MYSVRRVNWQTLVITDESGSAIDATLLAKWRTLGVAFVVPEFGKPSVVTIGFDDRMDTKEVAKPLMEKIIGQLSGNVQYCNIRGGAIAKSDWYL